MQGDAPRHKSNHLQEPILMGPTSHLLSLALVVYVQKGQKEVHCQEGQKQCPRKEDNEYVSKVCAPT